MNLRHFHTDDIYIHTSNTFLLNLVLIASLYALESSVNTTEIEIYKLDK